MNNFTFFTNYSEVIDSLPKELQAEFALALVNYGVKGEDPEFTNPILHSVFISLKYALDVSRTRAKIRQGKSNEKENVENKKEKKSNKIKTETNEDKHECIEKEIEIEKEKENKKEKPLRSAHSASRLEFDFYLWCFNKLFGREFLFSAERQKKLQTRRNKFTLEEIITSLELMATKKFFQGDNERGWIATPEYHLRNDENIIRFLEDEAGPTEVQRLKEKLPELKKQFLEWRKHES